MHVSVLRAVIKLTIILACGQEFTFVRSRCDHVMTAVTIVRCRYGHVLAAVTVVRCRYGHVMAAITVIRSRCDHVLVARVLYLRNKLYFTNKFPANF